MKYLFIHTHPIQYFAPLYAFLHHKGMDLEVWYGDAGNSSGRHFDHEFQQEVKWDIPLLEGYPYRIFENRGNPNGKRNYYSYDNPGMLEALEKEPPALVVVHGWNYKTYVALLRNARRYGHRLAFRGETNWDMEKQRPAYLKYFRHTALGFLLKDVDHFFYIGEKSRLFYKYLNVPDKKLHFTPYAVDNHRFRAQKQELDRAALREAYGLQPGDMVFLFTGKFIPKKKPVEILRAFSLLHAENVKLLMVGEGVLRDQMESVIQASGLQNSVTLTGFVNQSRIPEFYAMADVFIMASDFGETWGLSVNEAMNFSLPLILSDRTGCHADLLKPGGNGLLVPSGDIDALRHAMSAFADMEKEEIRLQGSRSLEIVENYSFRRIYETLEAIAQ